ncbi:GNAT family N-acetyltransferase [Schumannella luteola]|uniref:RimJ/RimL family protein N-acetyltransferase n=1 Tax=Schumannella luteola TaxID=472059 RepID=A0A852YCR5_9MICO|nr:RimJ/RimL family protein N-acetyltransferase [Schumannella luteola]TPX06417.1 GNAT family N-acetyltransferase [Schumannella luteola]
MDAILRPWSSGDLEALRSARASAADLDSQFGWDLDDAGAAEQHLVGALGFSEHARNWAITVQGVAVGNIGVSAIERRHGTAWAHYWLAASARGKGLAVRALASVAAHAFDDGLFRLELGHRVNNPASCRVATRAGFEPEGIERQKLRYGEARFDVETHARLASDPPPLTEPLPLPLVLPG